MHIIKNNNTIIAAIKAGTDKIQQLKLSSVLRFLQIESSFGIVAAAGGSKINLNFSSSCRRPSLFRGQ
jgi:hypothetical protein